MINKKRAGVANEAHTADGVPNFFLNYDMHHICCTELKLVN